jgi:rubrerythrin
MLIVGTLVGIFVFARAVGWAFASNARETQKRYENGLCMNCGYDLRESPGRCPECGMFM